MDGAVGCGDPVGLVVVSHSRALARAAVALAQEMLHGKQIRIAVAAGLFRLVSASAVMVPDFGARPFVVGAGIVLVATAVAALLPLRRAAQINPAHALRAQ